MTEEAKDELRTEVSKIKERFIALDNDEKTIEQQLQHLKDMLVERTKEIPSDQQKLLKSRTAADLLEEIHALDKKKIEVLNRRLESESKAREKAEASKQYMQHEIEKLKKNLSDIKSQLFTELEHVGQRNKEIIGLLESELKEKRSLESQKKELEIQVRILLNEKALNHQSAIQKRQRSSSNAKLRSFFSSDKVPSLPLLFGSSVNHNNSNNNQTSNPTTPRSEFVPSPRREKTHFNDDMQQLKRTTSNLTSENLKKLSKIHKNTGTIPMEDPLKYVLCSNCKKLIHLEDVNLHSLHCLL